MSPTARLLRGDRLHLQHGPSDLIIWAEGAQDQAYRAAVKRFETIIAEVVHELSDLRAMLSPLVRRPKGRVAQRMFDACLPYAAESYVTPMAAVAGAIADEVLDAMVQSADLSRAYVNNGGDIAVHLMPGTSFTTAMKGHDGSDLGRIEIVAEDEIGGIATSGRHGRSLSLGIADSVTVLARSAAAADVAATLVSNAVDLPGHSAITRRAACDIDDASDLGDLDVTVGCGRLSAADRGRALAAGQASAADYQARGLLSGAGLFLQGQAVTIGPQLSLTQHERIHVPA